MPTTTNFDANRTLPQPGRPIRNLPDPAALAQLLEAWMHEDETEQRATFQFLRHALDEERPAGFKLFA